MGRCFVAMPYGSTEDERREFSRIYRFLIRTAAEDLGLDCVRSDFEDRGGHILSNVIEDLVDSDIVIADLSGLNWNVAYELGMRHVFHKKGTVLICNSSTNLPFDVQSLNVMFYSDDWLDKEEELCEKLKKIIEGRLSGTTNSDSPVHDKYSFLPEDVVRGHSESTDENLKAAKEKIAQLEKELAATYERIESMGLSLSGESNNKKTDFSRMFLDELENSIYSGDEAVAKLRELLENEDKKGFVDFLGKVLEVGFIDETDCRIIYNLCRKIGNANINRKYLEAVIKFYPESEELLGYLANEYSKNYHTGEKALQMVNGIIGVTKKDGVYALSKTSRVTTGKLACFFDVYLHLKKYADIVEIGRLLCERYANNSKICAMVYRNMTNACIKMDDLDNAGIFIEKTIQYAPENDLSYYMRAKYVNALDDYPKTIENIETCIRLSPSDIDYYFLMSGYICDDQYARNPETMQIEKIDSKKADQCVLPFILTALTIDRSCGNRAIDFLRRNKFGEYINHIVDAFQSGVTNFRNQFNEFDYSAVDYCLADTE